MADHPTLEQQMTEAVRRQAAHAAASHAVDRRGWTGEQWVEDARRLMSDLDGSVLDLVNGHVMALLAYIKQLEADRVRLSDEAKHWCAEVIRLEKQLEQIGEQDSA